MENSNHSVIRRRSLMHDPRTLLGMLNELDLLEVQLSSIVRGPHLRLLTATDIMELHGKLDAAEAKFRENARVAGLDPHAPMSTLRNQIRLGFAPRLAVAV